MSELSDLVVLWRELYGVNRKAAAGELGISQAQYWRIEAGQTPLTMRRLRALGDVTDISLNTLLIAFMLLDDNVLKSNSEDAGDQFIRALHARIESEARRNETNRCAREILCRPQSIYAAVGEIIATRTNGANELDAIAPLSRTSFRGQSWER